MADTYFGIGKLNFFVFIVMYFMIVGVVSAVFDPAGRGLVPSQSGIEQGASRFPGAKPGALGKDPPKATIWSAIDLAKNLVTTGLGIIWAGMVFDVPGVPLLLRMFLTIPVIVVFVIVIVDILLDVVKTVKPSWL